MKRVFILILLSIFSSGALLAGNGFLGVSGGSQKFTLNDDIGSNKIKFLSEAPMETIHGTADGMWGSFVFDPANLEATKGEVSLKVLSMKTASSKRDIHMYSGSWLDAENFPTVTFTIKRLYDVQTQLVDGRHQAAAKAEGTFTIHGVTKTMTANVNITYLPASSETKQRASGDLAMITATFTVSLADFNIEGTNGIVGKSVGTQIKVEAKVFANS